MHGVFNSDQFNVIGAEVQLEMAQSLLGKIDVNEVLSETIEWMERRFDSASFDFYLSQDNNTVILPVKPFFIHNPDQDLCSKAFIEGRMALSELPDRVEAAAPLKGKQGIYGVLRLNLSDLSNVDEDIAYLEALAGYAGAAFEIAKLYEQSTKLVNELRTINELTKQLNKSLQLNDIFQLADRELVQVFAADYCCILLKDQSKQNLVVKASNAEELVEEQFDIQYGFAGIICRSKEPVIISDYQYDKHVDSKLMRVTKAKSLIGAPIIVGAETVGAILLVHRRPNYFSFENFKLLQVLSGHVGLAVTNAILHTEMRRMVITDQLTGLYVRNYLYEQIQMMQKKDACGALIVIDLDDFKKVNDTYGHQIGDQVLIQVSDIVRRSIRESDIAARWGGEELAVYLPLMNIEQAFKVAERIRNRIHKETDPRITISSGVADWRADDMRVSLDLLFHTADMALYEAKNSGKNLIRKSARGTSLLEE